MIDKFTIKLIQIAKWTSLITVILFIVIKQLQQQNIVAYYPLALASFFGLAAIEALVCNKISISGFVIEKTKSKLLFLCTVICLAIISLIFVAKFACNITAL